MQTIGASTPSKAAGTENAAFLPTPKQFFTILAAYFLLHVILRTLVSETAGIDEADQLVVGQKLSWGYGPHAPLYTWLMMLFLRVFGPSEFSLTLLREMLLFGTYSLTYLNARLLTRSHACGVAAAVALQFHPSIVWESQRELTHSLVASMMILAALFSFLRIRPERWGGWVAFGICGGLSVLSKYNAALFYFGMIISTLSLPSLRPRILNPRMAGSAGISLLLVSPNLWWVIHHPDLAFQSVYKFGIHESASWGAAVRLGLLTWLETAAAHLAPLLLIFAAIFWRPLIERRAPRLHTDEGKFLWRTFLIVSAVVVLSVLSLKVTGFKDRWLQPIFVSTPILLVVAFQESLDRTRLKVLLLLGLLFSVVVLVLAPGRMFLTESRNRREILNAPFRKFAWDLATPARHADFIVAGGYWLAGNLRLWFPGEHVFSTDLAPPDVRAGQRCLVIWDATRRAEPPAQLVNFASAFTGNPSRLTPIYIEEIWKYHHTKTMRLGFWVLERGGT